MVSFLPVLRADVGDGFAAGWLASLLAERGDLEGLGVRVDVGDGAAAGRMAEFLIKLGRG